MVAQRHDCGRIEARKYSLILFGLGERAFWNGKGFYLPLRGEFTMCDLGFGICGCWNITVAEWS